MTKSTKTKLAYMTKYEDSPEEIKKREERNLARQHALKAGKASVGDGTEVDHIKPLKDGGTNAPSNQRVVTAKTNRSWRKGKHGKDSYDPKK